jgi:hypothetical protein
MGANKKFGLEIPQLTTANRDLQESYRQHSGDSHQKWEDYQSEIDNSADINNRVGDFLAQNGVQSVVLCGSPLMIDVIGNDQRDPNALMGIIFYGSQELAQKLANAFPDYKVIEADSGKVITPSQAPAPKATERRPSPPHP